MRNFENGIGKKLIENKLKSNSGFFQFSFSLSVVSLLLTVQVLLSNQFSNSARILDWNVNCFDDLNLQIINILHNSLYNQLYYDQR